VSGKLLCTCEFWEVGEIELLYVALCSSAGYLLVGRSTRPIIMFLRLRAAVAGWIFNLNVFFYLGILATLA
jgi:hypothetical protein